MSLNLIPFLVAVGIFKTVLFGALLLSAVYSSRTGLVSGVGVIRAIDRRESA